MAQIIFFPLGNADSIFIKLNNDKKLLVDYAHSKSGEDEDDEKLDLATELRSRLDSKNPFFDVVAFTHSDEDHTRGAADFFEFDYAVKYQGNNRIKINELWVPAAMILEEGLSGDDQVIRQEARHRLRNGYGIRVFSSPNLLDKWFESENVSKSSREHLISDAGTIVPGLVREVDGLEVFVHSPFAHRDGDSLQSRNDGSLFFQLTFENLGVLSNVILGADTTHEVLEDIIKITRYHNRDEKLKWDIYKLSHHCSYGSLAAEKGDEITTPSENIDWLFDQTRPGSYIISPSWPIPDNDDSDQPPHRQAANYYKKKADNNRGYFKVTMEHPNKEKPEPMVFELDKNGVTLKKIFIGGSSVIINHSSPKVG